MPCAACVPCLATDHVCLRPQNKLDMYRAAMQPDGEAGEVADVDNKDKKGAALAGDPLVVDWVAVHVACLNRPDHLGEKWLRKVRCPSIVGRVGRHWPHCFGCVR